MLGKYSATEPWSQLISVFLVIGYTERKKEASASPSPSGVNARRDSPAEMKVLLP